MVFKSFFVDTRDGMKFGDAAVLHKFIFYPKHSHQVCIAMAVGKFQNSTSKSSFFAPVFNGNNMGVSLKNSMESVFIQRF